MEELETAQGAHGPHLLRFLDSSPGVRASR